MAPRFNDFVKDLETQNFTPEIKQKLKTAFFNAHIEQDPEYISLPAKAKERIKARITPVQDVPPGASITIPGQPDFSKAKIDIGPERKRPGFFVETTKGFARGFENLPAMTGQAIQWAGANVGSKTFGGAKKSQDVEDFEKKVKDTIVSFGKGMTEDWRQKAMTGWEAPDPEVFRGSFTENPSFTRAAAITAEAIPTLAAAVAIGAVTKSPWTGAWALGALEGSGTFVEAKEVGKSTKEANIYGGLSTIGTSLLETVPITRFLRGGSKKLTKDIVLGAVQEGTEEVAQAFWNNLIAKFGYDRTRKLTEGMVEGLVAGGMSGGLLGGLTSGRAAITDQMIKEAKEEGVTDEEIETIQEQLKNQIVSKADEIDERLQKQLPKEVRPKKAVKIAKPTAKAKQPWEMTREEFESTYANGLVGYINNLKSASMNEVSELTRQMVEAGLMAKADLKPFEVPEGFEKTNLGAIAVFSNLTSSAHFAHNTEIVKALAEGKKVPDAIMKQYEKWSWPDKNGDIVTLEEAVKSYQPTAEGKWYHGGAKGLESDLIGGMVTREYAEAKKYADEIGGVVYEVPDSAVIVATHKDTTADGLSLGPNPENYGFIKSVKKGDPGHKATIVKAPTAEVKPPIKPKTEEPPQPRVRQETIAPKPILKQGPQKESRAFKRVKDRYEDELKDTQALYTPITLAEDTAKAVLFVEQHPEVAQRVAKGLAPPPSGVTDTAIAFAYSEKMRESGNWGEFAKAERAVSLRLTRKGQDIAAARARVNENSPDHFIQMVLKQRLMLVGRALFPGVKKLGQSERQTQTTKATDRIRQEAGALKTKLSRDRIKIMDAQKIIDALVC